MKKTLLLTAVLFLTLETFAQVVVAGISPAAIQGNYEYGVQVGEGGWPGQTDDGTWAMALDFNTPGVNVIGELVMVNDGTPGTNTTYGNLLAEEGCAVSPPGAYAGKIAVIRRNTCNFSLKAYNAELAGAIAVIIVNREDALLGMTAGPDGVNTTIPVVIVQSTPGNALIAEMLNGPVTMFIGNKTGAFGDDAGATISNALVSKSTGVISHLAQNGTEFNFELGTRVYNYGANDQAAVTITANVNGPSGSSVYSNTVGPVSINSGDSIDIYPGDTYSFPQFALSSYPLGKYTLTYTIDLGIADELDFDNVLTSEFFVSDTMYSVARLDETTLMPISNAGYAPNTMTSTYSTCTVLDNPNASRIGVAGLYFSAVTNVSAAIDLTGEEMALSIYRWEDVFVDFNDPALAFDLLNPIGFGFYYYPSDLQDTMVYGALSAPVVLEDNQRYLACVQTVNLEIFLGHDTKTDYTWNQNTYLQPMFPVETDGVYSAGGFGSDLPSAVGVKVYSVAGIDESTSIDGIAYPNPATNAVTVSLNAEGTAQLSVTDLSGRVAMNNTINLVNGKSEVSISSLEAGMYIFNVTTEGGKTSQFNVVKK